MKMGDVTDTLDLALAGSGGDKVKVEHRPRLLFDNGPCYVGSDLGEWLEKYKIDQATVLLVIRKRRERLNAGIRR